MKRLPVGIATAMLVLTLLPMQLKAGTETSTASTSTTKTVESTEAKALLTRLDEIKAMDKSKLNSSVKKQLRKEVKESKDRLKVISGGVYLSVGAILIILILLIILL